MQDNLIGAARHRHEKRETAIKALEACGPDDAATIAAAVLDEIGAGSPRLDPWGDLRADAAFWADLANPSELQVYFSASLKRLGETPLGIHARKRLFMVIWDSFSDADQEAFLGRVASCGVAA